MIQTIVDYGGALSHHHSIGYEHEPWLNQYIGRYDI
ncbi:FAD-linked oxidase C-terminal domain-containing protein [Candidatus Coxiella mudrowiae]|nr:FAD-linked oxidase C-terminal domain-containing protein [Candidatus Coxiella mudrowiae]